MPRQWILTFWTGYVLGALTVLVAVGIVVALIAWRRRRGLAQLRGVDLDRAGALFNVKRPAWVSDADYRQAIVERIRRIG